VPCGTQQQRDEEGQRRGSSLRRKLSRRKRGSAEEDHCPAERSNTSGEGASAAEQSANHGASDDALLEHAPRLTYLQVVRGGYNDLVNAIIRPPRAEYSVQMLGPETFHVEGRVYERHDLELMNSRGQRLLSSHWRPRRVEGEPVRQVPCVVYLHGNASCRAESLECLPLILSSGMTLFAFDFSGSGQSDGKYISLGWHEQEDLEAVIQHLRSEGMTNTIGLWGRSMGAATALLYAHRDPSIAALVLDSPFASLRQLAKELSSTVNVPSFLTGLALRMVRSSVRARAKFDIFKLNPIGKAESSFIPALFGHGEHDNFILPHHSQQIHDRYAGDKNITFFEGDHSSPRPHYFLSSVAIFLHNTMISTALTEEEVLQHASPSDFNFAMHYTIPSPIIMHERSPSNSMPPNQENRTDDPNHLSDAPEAFLLERFRMEDNYYEDAMLRYAMELSLAETSGCSAEENAQERNSLDENEAEVEVQEVDEQDQRSSVKELATVAEASSELKEEEQEGKVSSEDQEECKEGSAEKRSPIGEQKPPSAEVGSVNDLNLPSNSEKNQNGPIFTLSETSANS